MKSKLLCLAFVVDVLTFCGPTFAHHGSAAYSNSVAVMKDAMVTRFTWNNPHCIVMFDVKDERGNVAHWAAEIGSPPAVSLLGWTRNSLQPGDVGTVYFWTGPITAKLNPVPPMTPWGQEQFRSHKNHSQYSEAESNDPMKYCDPMGFPRDMLYDNRGFAFAPMPGKVLQAFQFNRVWREIWTDGRELPKNVGGRSADAADPRWYGYSVGHWEGDYTFVVDTVGSDERTWLDSVGHPHSIDMYVQERYKRVDHNTLEMTM